MKHAALLIFAVGVIAAGLPAFLPRCSARSSDRELVSDRTGEEHEERGQKHEDLFKVINFALLVAGLAFLLRKPLKEVFLNRSGSIQRALKEGREALEASQARLRAVEEKLGRLEQELEAFKTSALKEMEAERERLRRATSEEVGKVLESTEARMETMTKAAIVELKRSTAQEALKLAEQLVRDRLDEPTCRRLVGRFIARLEGKSTQN